MGQISLGKDFWDRYWRRAIHLLVNFFTLSPLTFPNVFSKVNSAQFPSCEVTLERHAKGCARSRALARLDTRNGELGRKLTVKERLLKQIQYDDILFILTYTHSLFHSVLSVYSQDDAKLPFFQLYGVYQAADKPDLSPGNELLHANAAPRG